MQWRFELLRGSSNKSLFILLFVATLVRLYFFGKFIINSLLHKVVFLYRSNSWTVNLIAGSCFVKIKRCHDSELLSVKLKTQSVKNINNRFWEIIWSMFISCHDDALRKFRVAIIKTEPCIKIVYYKKYIITNALNFTAVKQNSIWQLFPAIRHTSLFWRSRRFYWSKHQQTQNRF